MNDLSGPESVASGAIGQPMRRKEDLRLLTGAGRDAERGARPAQRASCEYHAKRT
jgi:hypothetical protein